MEKKQGTQAGGGSGVDVVIVAPSSSANPDPDLDNKNQRHHHHLDPTSPAAPRAHASIPNRNDDEEEKPRFWTKYPSSRLNAPVEGEGLDLEAERHAHEAHERGETVCLGGKGGGAVSPGSGVAAAMARLGRESLSMAD